MFDNLLQPVWLAGWLIYLFGVYTPRMRRFRKLRIAREATRWQDGLLDFLTFLAWQVLPLIAIFASWLAFADYELPGWVGWIGAVLYAGAIGLLWRAYADLGANWSPKIDVREGQSLVTNGVYRRMRHPIYAGLWLWALAQPLLIQNWIAGPGMLVVFAPLYLTRVPREEAMMQQEFGQEYTAYMQRTGRVIPRLQGGE